MRDKLKQLIGIGKEEVDEEQLKENEDIEKLQNWKKKLNNSLSKHQGFRTAAAKWDELYNGNKSLDAVSSVYMSEKQADNIEKARQVVNLTYQLIESQIDTNIPMPRVDAMEEDDQGKNDMVEGMLTSIALSAELERLNNENERIVKKNSLAFFKVTYDPDYKEHSFTGRIKTINPHPVNIIPQPGVYKIEDMDYLFQIENRSLDYICRMYGEDFRNALEEENAEYGYLEQFSENTGHSSSDDGNLSVVECWYKDKDGDVGVLTWCNEVILKDTPKFYYKRDENGEPTTTETLEIEQTDELTGITQKVEIQVEAHIPKRFPYIVWYNIPKEKSFIGKSDPEVIKDQQEGIKKMVSLQEEKLIKGTTKIFVRKDTGLKNKISNSVTQIVECDDPQADINVVDLKTPDNSFLELYNVYSQAAKDTVGVTEASQGRAENSTLSGKALEQLAAYSQGRLSAKTSEKQTAYKELFNLYYDFLLAFYDDKIPFKVPGEDNKPKFGYFDKTKLLKQDVAGAYYYPNFDIYIAAEAGITKDKNALLAQAQEDFRIGAIDAVEYWSIKEKLGFPNATMILNMEKEKLAMQQQQAVMEQQSTMMNDPNMAIMEEIKNLPPDVQEAFMKMPPEKQQELLAEYMSMQEQ